VSISLDMACPSSRARGMPRSGPGYRCRLILTAGPPRWTRGRPDPAPTTMSPSRSGGDPWPRPRLLRRGTAEGSAARRADRRTPAGLARATSRPHHQGVDLPWICSATRAIGHRADHARGLGPKWWTSTKTPTCTSPARRKARRRRAQPPVHHHVRGVGFRLNATDTWRRPSAGAPGASPPAPCVSGCGSSASAYDYRHPAGPCPRCDCRRRAVIALTVTPVAMAWRRPWRLADAVLAPLAGGRGNREARSGSPGRPRRSAGTGGRPDQVAALTPPRARLSSLARADRDLPRTRRHQLRTPLTAFDAAGGDDRRGRHPDWWREECRAHPGRAPRAW